MNNIETRITNKIASTRGNRFLCRKFTIGFNNMENNRENNQNNEEINQI